MLHNVTARSNPWKIARKALTIHLRAIKHTIYSVTGLITGKRYLLYTIKKIINDIKQSVISTLQDNPHYVKLLVSSAVNSLPVYRGDGVGDRHTGGYPLLTTLGTPHNFSMTRLIHKEIVI